ncbi:hypothetical protein E2C01_085106 [Portunus trituberculatus]|uniref:Uncharacterized protein n=1 Tax=Portunus trituberculatus TaxID=210409 RepID=A0A5B7J9J8_PORTR|nr:hypothetical protein [Portunus trituberculatus]
MMIAAHLPVQRPYDGDHAAIRVHAQPVGAAEAKHDRAAFWVGTLERVHSSPHRRALTYHVQDGGAGLGGCGKGEYTGTVELVTDPQITPFLHRSTPPTTPPPSTRY